MFVHNNEFVVNADRRLTCAHALFFIRARVSIITVAPFRHRYYVFARKILHYHNACTIGTSPDFASSLVSAPLVSPLHCTRFRARSSYSVETCAAISVFRTSNFMREQKSVGPVKLKGNVADNARALVPAAAGCTTRVLSPPKKKKNKSNHNRV